MWPLTFTDRRITETHLLYLKKLLKKKKSDNFKGANIVTKASQSFVWHLLRVGMVCSSGSSFSTGIFWSLPFHNVCFAYERSLTLVGPNCFCWAGIPSAGRAGNLTEPLDLLSKWYFQEMKGLQFICNPLLMVPNFSPPAYEDFLPLQTPLQIHHLTEVETWVEILVDVFRHWATERVFFSWRARG